MKRGILAILAVALASDVVAAMMRVCAELKTCELAR